MNPTQNRPMNSSTKSLMLFCSRSFIHSLAELLTYANPFQSAGIHLFPILPLLAASFSTTGRHSDSEPFNLLLKYTVRYYTGSPKDKIQVLPFNSSELCSDGKYGKNILNFLPCFKRGKLYKNDFGMALFNDLLLVHNKVTSARKKVGFCDYYICNPHIPNNGSSSLAAVHTLSEPIRLALFAKPTKMRITDIRWYSFILPMNPILHSYIWKFFLLRLVNGASLLFLRRRGD